VALRVLEEPANLDLRRDVDGDPEPLLSRFLTSTDTWLAVFCATSRVVRLANDAPERGQVLRARG
jgi:hypothetical protein